MQLMRVEIAPAEEQPPLPATQASDSDPNISGDKTAWTVVGNRHYPPRSFARLTVARAAHRRRSCDEFTDYL